MDSFYRNALVLLAFSLAFFSFGCTFQLPSGAGNAPACGNRIVEGPEQCESGVACKIANMTCNMTDCTCRMPAPVNAPANYSCASNSKMVEAGIPNSFNATTMQCRDDCRNTTPGTVCDMKTCTCKKAAQTRGCVANTLLVNVANVNLFNPGTMMCLDDCIKIDPKMTCNANCVCQKAPPPPINCMANTNTVANGAANPFNAATMKCQDDCKNTDPALACDPLTCTCKKQGALTCMQNSLAVAFGAANNFNPFGGQCRDDCKTLDQNAVCDAATCLCKYPQNQTPPSSMPCATNTGLRAANVNVYDPAKSKCLDNCEQLGPAYACDAASCTCKAAVKTYNDCSARTVTGQTTREKVPAGTICRDDCVAKFGQGYTCDSLSCTCVAPGTYPTYSCIDNSLSIITAMSVAYPLPQHYQCKDDCNASGQNLVCDPQRCVCLPPATPGTVSCANHDFESAYNGGAAPATAAGQCKDDCKQFYGEKYYCDANCTCQYSPQQQAVSCASRQAGASALPASVQCRDDCAQGYTCDAATCTCTPPQTAGICGDGKILSPEQCDPGSYETNKCPQGTYCTKDCVCKKLETSVVCGDGKVSSPGEDCDGGSVVTNICQSGYTCKLCKCVASGTVAQCGDGRVTPPEECDHGNTYTSECPGGNTCYSCRCVPYGQVPQETHLECVHEACTEVSGAGEDECTSDEQCQAGPDCGDGEVEGNEECEDDGDCADDEYCSGCECVQRPVVCGDGKITGNEQCEEDGDCRSGYVCSGCICVQKPAQCGDGKVNGNEECDPQASPSGCEWPDECGTNCKCISPPNLDCDKICGYTSGAQSFPGSYTTEQCINSVKGRFGTRSCYLTCAYAYLYKVTNIAGSAYCCCGMKKEFPCSDCPGQNPQCPSQSTCDQNAPSWYSYR